MTFYDYRNEKKVQGQYVGYVKVRFFAYPLTRSVAFGRDATDKYEKEIESHIATYESLFQLQNKKPGIRNRL